MTLPSRNGWGTIAGLSLLVVLCGCAKEPVKVRPATFPVSGSLLIDGTPAVRAAITFHRTTPAADGKVYGPSAHTDDNGSFRITTFTAYDGAPPGEYKVTITAPWISKEGQDVEVPDLLRGKYADSKTTPLTVVVAERENELEQFDLSAGAAK